MSVNMSTAIAFVVAVAVLAVGTSATQGLPDCKCGPFSFPNPSKYTPTTDYITGMDIGGNDMAPCGPLGCKLDVSTTHADCSKLCSNTTGCYAYVFSPPSCDTPAGHNVCWLKSGLSTPTKHACRNYQVIKPILDPPFCPLVTQWGASITNTSTPLPEYPRPQMVRSAGWTNLNGFWEWQPASAGEAPPFGKTLNGSILVPFPTEACLSGVWKNVPRMWYRKVVAAEELRSQAASAAGGRTLLQFGAVDWMATVYVNGALAGNHTGGYSRITMDITAHLPASGSVELIVFVFDPSNFGQQVFGKQRVSAITDAGGDTYTPASGIWQTVWTEQVPSTYISDLKIVADTKQVTVNITTASGASQPRPATSATITVYDGTTVVATKAGPSPLSIPIPNPKLWGPLSPFLYNMTITAGDDKVDSYFGMREVTVAKDADGVMRPMINGKFTFLAGWLDQSFWPDGIYTAPTDAALAFDVEAVKTFGLNMIRLHQKVNPERWYWVADKLGIVVMQDMPQHYGDAVSTPSVELYFQDLAAMIDDVFNHPCIIQWEVFNEGDMVKHFDAAQVVNWTLNYDQSHRPVDTDSGGPANNLHVGNVNDIHTYPFPGSPTPADGQYGMVGEFGGIGAFVPGHEHWPGRCHTYLKKDTPHDEATTYIDMTEMILKNRDTTSACVYTQITDVELECDGFFNYDRTNKFSAADTAAIAAANEKLIRGH